MAKAIITLKIMPETADTDLKTLETQATAAIESEGGKVGKLERHPIAFGLQSLEIIFMSDETLGSDVFEQKVSEIEGVQSVQVVEFRRALG